MFNITNLSLKIKMNKSNTNLRLEFNANTRF